MKRLFLPIVLITMGVVSPTITTNAETLFMDNVSVADEYTELVLTKRQTSPDLPDFPNGPKRIKAKKEIYSSIDARLLDGVIYFTNEKDLSDVDVTITDVRGDIVYSTIIDIYSGSFEAVDISSLESGDYTLYVTIDGEDYYGLFSRE
ncbi:MAG: DUF3244 domain-containing protein [Bacteroidaceae bacterium]|nr:DUF3244 domain-containing protein [Bacteroidaceae bacterium]